MQEEHDKAISKQPLPESKSFRKFCEKCGLRNLYSDPDDFFPSYRSLEKMDERLVFNGLRYKSCEMIWCAENSEEAFNHGHVGRPVLSLSDQRTVVLSAVRFLDNDMWGAIHVVKSECEDE